MPLAMVQTALSRSGHPFFFLDQQDVLQYRLDLARIGGTLVLPGGTVDLTAISAIYVRPYDVRLTEALKDKQSGDADFEHALGFEDGLAAWLEMTQARVIHRPSAMASNASKPYQMELIRAAGFDVPDTLVTTDAAAVRSFREKHGTVIYKSLSAIRSIVSRLLPEHDGKLPDVSHCPTQFQEYVEGTDIRIHVVGEEMFGCEIVSDADDYRYPAHGGPQVRSWTVPDELAGRCRRLAAGLDLAVTGIDLRRTPDGRFYCFEANPSPGFSFYEEATGQPIAAAIARLLAEAPGRA